MCIVPDEKFTIASSQDYQDDFIFPQGFKLGVWGTFVLDWSELQLWQPLDLSCIIFFLFNNQFGFI